MILPFAAVFNCSLSKLLDVFCSNLRETRCHLESRTLALVSLLYEYHQCEFHPAFHLRLISSSQQYRHRRLLSPLLLLFFFKQLARGARAASYQVLQIRANIHQFSHRLRLNLLRQRVLDLPSPSGFNVFKIISRLAAAWQRNVELFRQTSRPVVQLLRSIRSSNE